MSDKLTELEELFDELQTHKQSKDEKSIKKEADRLLKEVNLRSTEDKYNIILACCFAEIFRICAPELPFKADKDNKKVYSFIIKQLKKLEDPTNEDYQYYFYLLTRVDEVKAFIPLIDIDFEQIISLFNILLSVIKYSQLHFKLTVEDPKEVMSISNDNRKLLINVIEAINLPGTFNSSSQSQKRSTAVFSSLQRNPYVSITYGQNTKKTDIIEKTLNPKWESEIKMKGDFPKVTLEVIDQNTEDKDSIIGTVSVNVKSISVNSEVEFTENIQRKQGPLETTILSILSSCLSSILGEDGDVLDVRLLELILHNLLPVSKEKSKKKRRQDVKLQERGCYKTVCNLIQGNATKMEYSIKEYFVNAFLMTEREDDRAKYLSLIRSLNLLSPKLLKSVFPILEKELENNNTEYRTLVVQCLSWIFIESSYAMTNYDSLLHSYLTRITDKEPNIRIIVIKTIERLSYSESLCKMIEKSLLDKKKEVRSQAIRSCCAIAKKNPEAIPDSFVDSVCQRVLDKEASVREIAMRSLANLFSQLQKENKQPYFSKVAIIPQTIISSYFRADWHFRYNVEQIISEELLPVVSSNIVQDRATSLLDLSVFLTDDEITSKAIQLILREKILFRRKFREYLRFAQNKLHANFLTTDDNIETILDELAQFFKVKSGGDKPEKKRGRKKQTETEEGEDVKKNKEEEIQDHLLYLHNNNQLIVYLDIISNNASTVAEVLSAKKKARGAVDKEEHKELVFAFIEKLTLTEIGFEIVPKMFSYILSLFEDENELETVHKMLSFMERISAVAPEYFVSSFPILKGMLNESEFFSVITLKMFTNIGPNLQSNEVIYKELKSLLIDLCKNGSPKQAKLAATSLCKIISNNDEFLKILNSFVELITTSEHLTAVLSSISQIARISNVVNVAHSSSFVSDFVIDSILSKSSKYNIKVQMEGIKLLANNAIKTKDRKYIDKISTILQTYGTLATSEIDRSHLREISLLSILKLASNKATQSLVNQSYLLIAREVKDPCVQVRERLATKLHKYLKNLSLPLAFLPFLILFCCDPSSQIRSKAVDYFKDIVASRRAHYEKLKAAKHSLSLLPETSSPYLIYVISHTLDFEDPSSHNIAYKYLFTFIELMNDASFHDALSKLFEKMKVSKDSKSPNNNNHKILCEMAINILKKKFKATRKRVFTGDFNIPSIYIDENDTEVDEELEKNYLEDWTVPKDLKKITHSVGYKIGDEETVREFNRISKKRSRNEGSDEEEMEEEDPRETEEDEEEKPSSPPRKRKKSNNTSAKKSPRGKKKKQIIEESSEEELSPNDEVEIFKKKMKLQMSSTPPTRKSPRSSTTVSPKSLYFSSSDDENEEVMHSSDSDDDDKKKKKKSSVNDKKKEKSKDEEDLDLSVYNSTSEEEKEEEEEKEKHPKKTQSPRKSPRKSVEKSPKKTPEKTEKTEKKRGRPPKNAVKDSPKKVKESPAKSPKKTPVKESPKKKQKVVSEEEDEVMASSSEEEMEEKKPPRKSPAKSPKKTPEKTEKKRGRPPKKTQQNKAGKRGRPKK